MNKRDIVPLLCLIILGIFTIATGIKPAHRVPWLLEASMVWIFVILLIIFFKKLRFSNYVYVFLMIFLFLPLIGGFYSFDKVPYGEKLDFSGQDINQYDRFVHLMFGILVTPFLYELIKKTTPIKKGFWLFALPIIIILAAGAFYEITEYASALVFAPETVEIWVGLKGDQFDAQKDMFLGAVGSIISMAGIFILKKKNN